jgi:hypothetical protein
MLCTAAGESRVKRRSTYFLCPGPATRRATASSSHTGIPQLGRIAGVHVISHCAGSLLAVHRATSGTFPDLWFRLTALRAPGFKGVTLFFALRPLPTWRATIGGLSATDAMPSPALHAISLGFHIHDTPVSSLRFPVRFCIHFCSPRCFRFNRYLTLPSCVQVALGARV